MLEQTLRILPQDCQSARGRKSGLAASAQVDLLAVVLIVSLPGIPGSDSARETSQRLQATDMAMAMDRLVKRRSLRRSPKSKVPLTALGSHEANESLATAEGLLPTGTTKTLQGGVTIKAHFTGLQGALKSCNWRRCFERLPRKHHSQQRAAK